MKGQLEGRSIIVTGGASGIGRAAANHFASQGARVTIADINSEGGAAVLREIEAAGNLAQFVVADVTLESDVERLVAMAVQTYGKLDGAFNNAGIDSASAPVHEIAFDDWQRVLATDLNGVFLCMKHEIRSMLSSGGGAIVNTASGLAQVALPAMSDYCVAKAGVVALTKAAAVDYGRLGIRVNAILPGVTLTPPTLERIEKYPGFEEAVTARHPMGRFGKPEELAQSAAWLLSDAASFMTGSIVAVDGGYLAM